jgi:pyruvate formate lyase activating enzyme
MTVDEVVTEVLRDRPFYVRSNGGVTLSGGEPGLRSAFSREILARCRAEGIHTAIETCGNCHWHDLVEILSVTDLVMMDIKLIMPEAHRKATGSSNERILKNARLLAATNVPILFRTPIVPSVNDDPIEFRRIASFVADLVSVRAGSTNGDQPAPIALELLPFHNMATDKYRSLDMDYRAAGLKPPSKETMEMLAGIAAAEGLNVTVR